MVICKVYHMGTIWLSQCFQYLENPACELYAWCDAHKLLVLTCANAGDYFAVWQP